MQKKLTLSAEHLAKLDGAIARLSDAEYPKVRIADPAKQIGGIGVYGQRVDWFRLCQYKREIGHDLLPLRDELALFERGVHIAASRKQLVALHEVLPADCLSVKGSHAAIRIEAIMPATVKSDYVQTFDPNDTWPDPGECVREGTALMFATPREQPFDKEVHLYRFVAKHKVSPEDWPSVAGLFAQAEARPGPEHSAPPTEEVLRIASLLKDIDNFGLA